jgi:hypothetical protein
VTKTATLLAVSRATVSKVIIFNCSILLHCIDLTLRSAFCCLCAMLVNILSSFSLYCHYMFWPNWPSSGVQVVVMKESVAHCNKRQLHKKTRTTYQKAVDSILTTTCTPDGQLGQNMVVTIKRKQ